MHRALAATSWTRPSSQPYVQPNVSGPSPGVPQQPVQSIHQQPPPALPVQNVNPALVSSTSGSSGAVQPVQAQRNLNVDWQLQQTMWMSAEEAEISRLQASIAARKVHLGYQTADLSGATSGPPGPAESSTLNKHSTTRQQYKTIQLVTPHGLQNASQPLQSTFVNSGAGQYPGPTPSGGGSGSRNDPPPPDPDDDPDKKKRNKEIDAKRKDDFEINSDSLKNSKAHARGNMKCEVEKFERGWISPSKTGLYKWKPTSGLDKFRQMHSSVSC